MNISEFIAKFTNHPVLFIGTGLSLRYLQTAYTWDGLLQKVSTSIHDSDEPYLNLKSKCQKNDVFCYEKIAEELESEFNTYLEKNRNERFKPINDIFFENMRLHRNISRFKLYVSQLLGEIQYKPEQSDEIAVLKKVRKNIGSIITTNYDKLIEDIFEFSPLMGNDILLSNPYGSVYKIHGCIDAPDRIIITEKDYADFKQKYELVRAQLLSLFIHHPIIFIGYNIGDKNIKDILQTIFTYVEPNSEQATTIRNNFLLIEHEPNSTNLVVNEHDVEIEGISTIRINKIKTDNYSAVYDALSKLELPVSAMDIRKVQNIVREICYGGKNNTIAVNITENLEDLNNSDMVLVIGSSQTIVYEYQNTSEMMQNYFKIIEEENIPLIELINKHTIPSSNFFPIFGFAKLTNNIQKFTTLKEHQLQKLNALSSNLPEICKDPHNSIADIQGNTEISQSNQLHTIAFHTFNKNLELAEVKLYLTAMEKKDNTDYRRLLCAYDYAMYAPTGEQND